MFKRRMKPKNCEIDLKRTFAHEIEYYCKTSLLDEIVCKKEKVAFSKELAEAIEVVVRHYFIVKKNQEYCIISGTLLEKYLKDNIIGELPQSDKAKQCIDHYIKSLGY